MTTWLTVEAQLLEWFCPSCPVGERARAEFCDSNLGYYLSLLALPFACTALAALFFGRAHFAPRPAKPKEN